ncbi:hypothetical protein L6164_013000 [Bauhinia variegata]|uniref:Uncharacterized protein n=1 Tax=Bauhinia variegata TaxID=167791 RepID=A0ACB9PBR0_BAUVA|nr:hypothetical protein L6164_013000 [Bauhinia variegata]
MDIVISAKRELSDLIFYKNMDDSLKEKLRELVEARDGVQVLVKAAIMNGEEIMHDVQTWLRSADEAIKEFRRDEDASKIKFFISPSSRRQLRKRADKILSQLLDRSKFHLISYSCRPPFLSVLTSDLQEFDSRKTIWEGLMEALFNDNIKVIGIWGTAGVGKTTLVTQVTKQAHVFSVVINVFVTGNPDLGKIQTEIADALGLTLEENGVSDRAAKLYMRLKQERRVLLILDYVWGPLNLVEMEKEIGIPEERVKMVVISRDENVLLQMEAQRVFLIEPLPQDQAFSWFLKVSSVTRFDLPFCDLAVDIVNKCGGLPVLLLAVANTLRNKNLSVWNAAWWQLERNYEDVYLAVFSILDTSLEYLESYERNMLTLCAALGEEISLEHLLKFYFSCIFSETSYVEDARRGMVKHIRTLEGLSLLQSGHTSDFVTLDNAIRHRALQASHNMFVVRDGYEHKKWPDDRLIGKITAIFLLGYHKDELPQRLACPDLKLLHINDESQTLAIPDSFFEQINGECFQVLSLINMKLPLLPLSIRLLKSIQTLCLDNCVLGDISLVGNLSSLKVLSLLGSNIDQLPYHIRNLTNLCLLDLRNCSGLETIPPNVISNLTNLQELLLPNSFGNWQYSDGSNDKRTNASIDELGHLNNLQALDMHIPDEMVIPRELPLNILRSYNISIGKVKGQWSRNFTRNLHLNLNINIEEYNWVKMLLKDAEELWLRELKGFKAFQSDNEGFPKLRHLHILDAAEIECLIEPMQENPFPYLELLVLNNLLNFKMLWHSQARFYALRVVIVKHCDALEFIFSLPNISRYVSELTEMEITNCSNLESIVKRKEDVYGGFKFPQLRTLTLQNLPKLIGFLTMEVNQEESLNSCPLFRKVESPILKQLNLRGLDQLKNICNDPHFKDTYDFDPPDLEQLNELGLDQLTNIWSDPLFRDNYQLNERGLFQLKLLCKDTRFWDNYQVEFPILEQLNLHGLDQLTNICKGPHLSFSMLKSLQLFGCDNLMCLFSLPVAKGLLHLQVIKIIDCRSIEEIIALEPDTAAVTPTDMIVLPKVETLIFENLAELYSFCWDGCIFEWQSLKKVRVVKCPKMTWGALGIVNKSNLKVEVKDCPWQKEGEPESSTEYLFLTLDLLLTQTVVDIKSSEELRLLETELQPLSFRKLRKLSASNCDENLTEFLSQVLPRLYELEQLEVKQCELLTQIVNLQRLVADKNRKGKFFAQLKTIKLRDLPKLSCICDKDPAGIHFLHNLQEIEIHNCGSLKSIFSTSLVQQLQKLKVIKVHSCPILEDVFDLHSEEEAGRTEIVLRHLKNLELVHLPNFTKLNPFQFPFVLSLRIEDCPLLDALDTTFGKSKEALSEVMVAYKNVENLKLVSLHKLEEIWKGFSSPTSFSELKEVEVNNLSKLKCAISSKMLLILKNLEKLTITNCCSVIEVFELHEGSDFPSARFPPSTPGLPKLRILQVKSCDNLQHLVFPPHCLNKLKSLEISKCAVLEQVFQFTDFHIRQETDLEFIVLEQLPKLSSFCWEKLEFPSLVEARVIDCPELKIFPSGILVPGRVLPAANSSMDFPFQSPEPESLLPAGNSFFTNDKDPFRKLQKLHIRNVNYCQKIWNDIAHQNPLGELKFMVLERSSTLLNIIPSSLLIMMRNLEEITVKECTALKVAFEIAAHYSDEIVQRGLLPQLKELTLIDLPEMKLWNQEPSIPVFKNLKLLEIIGCCSLKKLFSISIAKNLEQLELLKVYECDKMELILEGEVGSTKVLEFPSLKCLILKHLPNLTCFCGHDFDINLPKLEMVRVKDIPKMETFAKATNTPNLKEVYVTYVTKYWRGDLNKTIKYLYDQPVSEQAWSSSSGHGQIPSEMLYYDGQDGEESAIVPVLHLEPQEHNEGAARQTLKLFTEVPEEAMILAVEQGPNCDSENKSLTWKSPRGERVAVVDVEDDKELLMSVVIEDNVVEEILEACDRRPGFLPTHSDVLRRMLSQHPVLTGPFRGKSSYFAAMSYELLASVLLVVEGRNLTKMLDADFNALLLQLEELKMIGFDHCWLEALRDGIIAQRRRNFGEIERS